MKTYLINLDRNPKRLAFMRRQLDALDLPYERFPAVCGKTLSPAARAAGFSSVRSFIASKKRMSAAEVGVALSHVGCYRRLLAADAPMALVLEDDVVLEPGFRETLARVGRFLDPAKPQVVVLSGYGVADAATRPEEIRAESSIWCADAYCLTRTAAALLLKANDPVITVADSFKRWHRRFGLELYRALPATVRQDNVTFASENLVLPKSNFLVRNVLWLADWVLWKVTGR